MHGSPPPGSQGYGATPPPASVAPGYAAPTPAPPGYGPIGYGAPPAAFGAPPGFGAPMPQTDGRAGIALVLGILSMTCAGFVAGIPAVILGLLAKRDIDRSGGAKTGTGLALGGVVTGVMGTLVSAAISLLVIAGIVSGASEAANAPHGSPHASPQDERTDLPEPDHAQNPNKGNKGKSGTAVPVAPGAKMVGTVQVVTLDPDDDRDLEDQLDAAAAAAQGRQLVVQTSASWCGPCREFDTSLSDPRMQRALGRVTIVKVDVDAFKDDLKAMNIVTKSVPWFYKMDGDLRPVDAISAGEWDANIPANMAPVFEAFLAGRLTKRREPSPLRGPQL